ncbi:MAG: hypothetical protein ACRCUS_03795 [Anaerovoracaceae bacterium]
MAGPKKIKLTETLKLSDVEKMMKEHIPQDKYGKYGKSDVYGRPYITVGVNDYALVLVYPEFKKVIIQSYPRNPKLVATKIGMEAIKDINRNVIPLIYEDMLEVLKPYLREKKAPFWKKK